MKVVAISDVHEKWKKLIIPECDLLISAGDYSFLGELHTVRNFHAWLNKQPAKYIISLQGNHEVFVEKNFELCKQVALEKCPRVNFIEEGLVVIDDINIWCSAITPEFFNWAYNRDRGEQIQSHWDKVPKNIDILVTHGPPYGILDTNLEGENCGCKDLRNSLERINPNYHVFGHIHEGYGKSKVDGLRTNFINASSVNRQYQLVNEPILFEI